jgi:hypothetical protein
MERIWGQRPTIRPKRAVGPKVSRIIKATSLSFRLDKIVRIKDAHGKQLNKVREQVERFEFRELDEYLRKILRIVLLDYEVEEWICISKGIRFSDKPSEELRRRENYEKYKLPNYADELDIRKLREGSRSFREFVEAVEDPL